MILRFIIGSVYLVFLLGSVVSDPSFLSKEDFFCSKKATLRGLLDGCWMEAGHQKNQAGIKSLEFVVSPPTFHKGERAWK